MSCMTALMYKIFEREILMTIKPIKNSKDYKNMLQEIESLMFAKKNTPEGDKLDILVTLVEAYERKKFVKEQPDPIEAIKFRMDQMGLKAKDLEPMIGRLNRVYEILNKKRPLTLKMIWNLHRQLGIPAEVLINPA